MIGNHNSNNNKTQTQMRNTQQHTDNIDELLESILRKKNLFTTNLQQHSMTANRKEDTDEESDDKLPLLHERFHWDNNSDDEENPEEIERNRMRYNTKFK